MSRPGTLVALETSGPVGSVAIATGSHVRARRFLLEPRDHARAVVPALGEVLAECGTGVGGLDGVVVGAGPGSFTGVRVAAATAKGLVHALGVPLWAVSSLEAAALTAEVLRSVPAPWPEWASGEGLLLPRLVLFDARGRRLFAAVYRGSSATFGTVRAPWFTTLDDLLDDPALAGVIACGDGAVRHRDELERAGHAVASPPAGVPTADALLRRVIDEGPPPLADPFAWEPDYLRATGAERSRGGPVGSVG